MKKIIKGYVQAMDGETLLVNTETDELVQIKIKDRVERWGWYCKHITITIKEDER